MDGVLGYDPVLLVQRWWQPTYQDVGRAGAVTPDVLRGTRGFCSVGPCVQERFEGGLVFFKGALVGVCF